MGLRMKFNLVLLLAFVIGLALAAYLSDRILKENARQEVIQSARIMMESALGARAYTAEHIKPLLTLADEAAVSAPDGVGLRSGAEFQGAAGQVPRIYLQGSRAQSDQPNDRASDWEADIINEFRNNAERKELIVERDTPTGRMLNLARPLGHLRRRLPNLPRQGRGRAQDHDRYLWSQQRLRLETERDHWRSGGDGADVGAAGPSPANFHHLHVLLGGVFLLLLVLLNILLHFVVIRPVVRMAEIATEVSMGKPDVPEYVKSGSDEISSLSQSFSRMRLSLESAMKMLGE
jgi:HAMP domain-containing protein